MVGADGSRSGLHYSGVCTWLTTVERLQGRRLRETLQAIQAAEVEVLEVWRLQALARHRAELAKAKQRSPR